MNTMIEPAEGTEMTTTPDTSNTVATDRFGKLRSEATRLKSEAGVKARSAAEEGKFKAADTLGNVSQATRDAAEKLKGGNADALAGLVATAADSIEGFAKRMREKSVDDMIDDTREMIRRSPVVVIAVAAAVGFLVSRFLKATNRDELDY